MASNKDTGGDEEHAESGTPLRVLYLIDSLGPGGAESLLYYFLKTAAGDSRFLFEVCTLYPGGTFEERVRSLGVPVHCLNFSRKYSPAGAFRLCRLMGHQHFDIVHVHLFPASAYAALTSIFKRGPIYVLTEHSEYNRRRGLQILRMLDRWLYGRFSWILAVGESTRVALLKWLPELAERTLLIENAVPVDDIRNIREQSPLPPDIDVLFVGRLMQAKNVDVLLEALAKSELQLGRFIKARIVGDGPLRHRMQELASKLNLSDTEFVGTQDNIYEWMARSRVMVIPSQWEGLPMVLLEAMAIGLPVICTPAGAMGSVISDGETGLIVPVGDASALSSSIGALLEDQTLASELALAARRRVEQRYDIRQMVDRTLSFYEQLR